MVFILSFLGAFILMSLIDNGCLGCIGRFVFIVGIIVLLVNLFS